MVVAQPWSIRHRFDIVHVEILSLSTTARFCLFAKFTTKVVVMASNRQLFVDCEDIYRRRFDIQYRLIFRYRIGVASASHLVGGVGRELQEKCQVCPCTTPSPSQHCSDRCPCVCCRSASRPRTPPDTTSPSCAPTWTPRPREALG